MMLSLSEIEALSKRGARGAGLSWGMAEEAGKATRWLCAHGVAGADVLASRLSMDMAGLVCPLTFGVALSDRPELARGAMQAGPVACPLLVVPFVATAARVLEVPLMVVWARAGVILQPDGHIMRMRMDGFGARECLHLAVKDGTGHNGTPLEPATRAEVSDAAYSILCAAEMRTFAPATEASRLAGAGAGLSDND